MKNRDYLAVLESLSELIDEGIQCVDSDGVTFFYNKKMAQLEDTDADSVIGKGFADIYPAFPESESTLLKAIRENEPTLNKQQTYFNIAGKEITTINTTVPIKSGGKVIGALEVAKDITQLREMTDKIIEYQGGAIRRQPRNKGNGVRNYTYDDIIGHDEKISKLKRETLRVADNPYPVLITGETGTGKELFAQSIHFASSRADKPFLAQNCAALPSSLLESILFGTVKGGFTGATDRPGMFEQASGGTLLLDEINAMPYSLQSKLLRVLQENYVRRIGGSKDIPIDVRVIAISNEPIENLIKEGSFRKDLYYRLNTITFEIPPLRERRDDIPDLVSEFIDKHNDMLGTSIKGISEEAMQRLMDYDYYGNVRELENIIVAAMSSNDDGEIIQAEDIYFNRLNEVTNNPLKGSGVAGKFNLSDMDGMTLPEKMKQIENEIIDQVIESNNGNISRSAKQLGIKRQRLQY
ncbi:MAG: sigma 54-interacting transcriptional regulator, partial [Bacillota bacterium]|nr:sigma 54-interacting transcriptional regulator [Bacillota bacterium]